METVNPTQAPMATDEPSPDPQETFKAPAAAGTLGVWLFTAGLTIAFAWLLIGYAVTRMGDDTPRITMPIWFWFSTFVILVSSVTLQWSFLSAKADRLATAGVALRLTTVLGLIFVALQTPGLVKLVQLNHQADTVGASYLLALALVCLHGMHVLGGLVRLAILNKSNHTCCANEDGAASLKQMCLYWHFLAVVWVAMFGVIMWA